MHEPDAWQAATALHDEVHEDVAFYLCRAQTCQAVKDALYENWRQERPDLASGTYPELLWLRSHDCFESVGASYSVSAVVVEEAMERLARRCKPRVAAPPLRHAAT